MTDQPLGGLYGPFLIVQELPPLRIPLAQEPETGLLTHATPRERYTTFATQAEAEACIRRDTKEREARRWTALERLTLAIVTRDSWEATVDYQSSRSRRRKGKGPR